MERCRASPEAPARSADVDADAPPPMLMRDPGETSCSRLLSTLTTTLHPRTYVFISLSPVSPLPPLAEVQLLFREPEGITIVTSMDFAVAHKMHYFFPCRMITLNVTSSLEAVGFMAVLATRLAMRNMAVNPASGFYHDHLFVPLGREDEAVEVLAAVADESRRDVVALAADDQHRA